MGAIEPVLCPDCGGPMVSRKNGKDGTVFWGCGRFPKCTGTRNTDGEAKHDKARSGAAEDTYDWPSDRARRNDRRRWRA